MKEHRQHLASSEQLAQHNICVSGIWKFLWGENSEEERGRGDDVFSSPSTAVHVYVCWLSLVSRRCGYDRTIPVQLMPVYLISVYIKAVYLMSVSM